MSLLSIVIALIVTGVFLWLINSFVPMDRNIKTILNVVVVIMVMVWVLNAGGVFGSQSSMHLGSLHVRW
jgi:predicted membrane protein